MNGFDVHYAQVDEGSTTLSTQTAAVRNQIDTLDAQMQAVKADLEGDMATEYDRKVASWRNNVADMQFLLGKAQEALNEIRTNYTATDGREAMKWQALM
ncbi:WXG100 family type VII secretion target [Nocardiopsis quinghaiensis]|uniref:WXG100 family type VII secretion target n=1 Tax=Nocardiopsis quinghaiensis TaxID=464995 RepID=UPI00123A711F|nr:WXG100 family type VII secretion target [Nocardiopsis quinghaiensis]